MIYAFDLTCPQCGDDLVHQASGRPYDLRRDTEHRYGHAAALDLLDIAPAPAAPPATVDGQLSLFEAAS